MIQIKSMDDLMKLLLKDSQNTEDLERLKEKLTKNKPSNSGYNVYAYPAKFYEIGISIQAYHILTWGRAVDSVRFRNHDM